MEDQEDGDEVGGAEDCGQFCEGLSEEDGWWVYEDSELWVGLEGYTQ